MREDVKKIEFAVLSCLGILGVAKGDGCEEFSCIEVLELNDSELSGRQIAVREAPLSNIHRNVQEPLCPFNACRTPHASEPM